MHEKMEHEGLDLQGPRVLQIPKVSQYRDHLWQLVLHSFAHPKLILSCLPWQLPPYHLHLPFIILTTSCMFDCGLSVPWKTLAPGMESSS